MSYLFHDRQLLRVFEDDEPFVLRTASAGLEAGFTTGRFLRRVREGFKHFTRLDCTDFITALEGREELRSAKTPLNKF